MDIKDIFHVLGRRHQVPIAKHQKTNALVTTTQFQRWIISPTSCELLVHGEFKGKEPHYVSALSVFSANLVRALRWRERFVSLVFFCGNHVEDDDQPLGGRAMIRSFTVQLLRHSSLDDVLRDHPVEVDEERIRKGNIAHLCALFSWLIHRLPKYFVVVCIIEGISHYETDHFEDGMLRVLGAVLELARDPEVAAAVKVLATSPTTTEMVHHRFKDDDSCFLSLSEVRQAVQGTGSSFQESDSE